MPYDLWYSVFCVHRGGSYTNCWELFTSRTPGSPIYRVYGLQERRPQSHKKIILTKIVIKLKHNIDSCFHMIVLYLLKEKKSRFKRREFSFNIYLVKINSGGPQVFFRWVLLFQMQFVCHIYVLVIIIQDHLTDS